MRLRSIASGTPARSWRPSSPRRGWRPTTRRRSCRWTTTRVPAASLGSKALEAGAEQLHDEAPGNVAFRWSIGDKAKTDEHFTRAAKTVSLTLRNTRLVPNAIEPRASLAQYVSGTGEFTLWTTSQNPHIHRLIIAAFILGVPEHKLRVISPDVGGGFGSKIVPYPEEVIVLHAARLLNRPVRWTARRTESFVSDCHGRDHESEAELAVDADGHVLGLRVKTIANLGAYLSLFAPAIPTYLYGTLMNATYRFPAVSCEVTGVFTNTTPVDAAARRRTAGSDLSRRAADEPYGRRARR